jgi:hypothetical protein
VLLIAANFVLPVLLCAQKRKVEFRHIDPFDLLPASLGATCIGTRERMLGPIRRRACRDDDQLAAALMA